MKELELLLSQVEVFAEPSVELEQYHTPAHIAARLLFTMHATFGDIEDKSVGDFGCGGGTLALGAAMLGAGSVLGLELDPAALALAAANADDFGIELELVHCDVAGLAAMPPAPVGAAGPTLLDTIVMNPPFGTRCKGVDMAFLALALRRCSGAVYSLHKTSTRAHVLKSARSMGAEPEVLAELKYPIARSYDFHKKKSQDVAVDFIRFAVARGDAAAQASQSGRQAAGRTAAAAAKQAAGEQRRRGKASVRKGGGGRNLRKR